VRRPQARAEPRLPAEEVERPVTVRPVVAVEEPPFLLAVQGVGGRVQVQQDLWRGFPVGGEKHLDQHPIHRRRLQRDLLVAFVCVDFRRGELPTLQRALARPGLARVALAPPTLAPQVRLLDQHPQPGMVA